MKALLSPVGIYWFVAVFFTNLRTCIDGETAVTSTLGTEAPSVEEYLSM